MSSPSPDAAAAPRAGLLFIGDPHLAHRPPGHRTDGYPDDIAAKLAWCLETARRERLLPVLLGDLFHWPRDNSNALLVRLLDLLLGSGAAPIPAIAGNHDMRFGSLDDDDSLSVLVRAGAIDPLDRRPAALPRRERLGGRDVVLGGTPWGAPLPTAAASRGPREGAPVDAKSAAADEAAPPVDADDDADAPLVVWITHHDLIFPGTEDVGRARPPELPGVDLAVNGHIHRPASEPVRAGRTTWFNPGSISRLTRSPATRARRPGVLRVLVDGAGRWEATRLEVPHRPFEEVFHEPDLVDEPETPTEESAFVRGLEQLVARRTTTGQGLRDFLAANLSAFPEEISRDVRELADLALAERDGGAAGGAAGGAGETD